MRSRIGVLMRVPHPLVLAGLSVALPIFLGAALPVLAAPVVQARWYGSIACSGGPLDLAIVGGNIYPIRIWVERPSAPAWGYEFELVVGAAGGGALPDAWRFDTAGCQPAGFLVLEDIYLVDPANFCPYFGGIVPHQVTRTINFDPSTNRLHLRLRAEFPEAWQPDSTRAYRTGQATFDHSYSVAGTAGPGECGGVEQALCIGVTAGWIDDAGVTHAWPVGTPFLTANGAGVACDAVPVQGTTWGTIKAQYR